MDNNLEGISALISVLPYVLAEATDGLKTVATIFSQILRYENENDEISLAVLISTADQKKLATEAKKYVLAQLKIADATGCVNPQPEVLYLFELAITENPNCYDSVGIEMLMRLGTEGMGVLLQLLDTKDNSLQNNLAQRMSEVHPSAYPEFEKVLKNAGPRLKRGVLLFMDLTLARTSFPDYMVGIEPFVPYLKDKDVEVRKVALKAVENRASFLSEESLHYKEDVKALKAMKPILQAMAKDANDEISTSATKILESDEYIKLFEE